MRWLHDLVEISIGATSINPAHPPTARDDGDDGPPAMGARRTRGPYSGDRREPVFFSGGGRGAHTPGQPARLYPA